MPPKLLYSSPDGTVLEHPHLIALVRSGDDILVPSEHPLLLPPYSNLVSLPGRRPVGLDPSSGKIEVLERARSHGIRFYPNAVAATLPPGYIRTFLPASTPNRDHAPPLSQWAYTAVGWSSSHQKPVFWAIRTDRRTHWNPSRFSTPDLVSKVEDLLLRFPHNHLLLQLKRCALEYRCFTAQNIFFCRDEGGLPSSTTCNANCLGCISQTNPGGSISSMERLTQPPSAQEIAEVGAHHLAHAQGRIMVSYGQGCEGEPLTRAATLIEATRLMRQHTANGTIHINTNASLPHALEELLKTGLESIRVSLNSANPELYHAYYRPVGFSFSEVESSLKIAQKHNAYIALNLLILPGVNDRPQEVKALVDLIARYHIHQLQTRSLCIDSDSYISLAHKHAAQDTPIGIKNMLQLLRQEIPWLKIGNFSLAKNER